MRVEEVRGKARKKHTATRRRRVWCPRARDEERKDISFRDPPDFT
jgi:hypothetical protein